MLDNQERFSIPVYSVSDLNAYIRALLESNENLMDIWVSGEVSNLSQPRSGHIYFTLKDENAQVRCVIWRNQAMRLAGALRDGLMVEAHGAVGVYESGGQYQLYVDGVRTAGEGRLFQEFLRLKEALTAEGLFDESRKRLLPAQPQVIGIVTSATGAALQDMLNTLRGRYPLAQVVVSPASVQGDAAPAEIVDALALLNQYIQPDVILLGRGGGSLEDLWAFNDERVVRAVVSSKAPVISGVGHETDYTLTDFAADFRAPTPTGAAVAAVPDADDLRDMLNGYASILQSQARAAADGWRRVLSESAFRLQNTSPRGKIRQKMQTMDRTSLRLDHMEERYFESKKRWLEVAVERLAAYDPQGILNRGYAIITGAGGKHILSVEQVQLGDQINARVRDGMIESEVGGIKPLKVKKYGKEK